MCRGCCRLSVIVFVRRLVFLCPNATFIYMWTIQTNRVYPISFICMWIIQTSKVYSIRGKKVESMVVNMLHSWSHRYSNHKSNINYVYSTIKYVGFELIHYTI